MICAFFHSFHLWKKKPEINFSRQQLIAEFFFIPDNFKANDPNVSILVRHHNRINGNSHTTTATSHSQITLNSTPAEQFNPSHQKE